MLWEVDGEVIIHDHEMYIAFNKGVYLQIYKLCIHVTITTVFFFFLICRYH